MPVVNATEEFEAWIRDLSHREQRAVLRAVKLLEAVGVVWEAHLAGLARENEP
jgi:hypothetical protein